MPPRKKKAAQGDPQLVIRRIEIKWNGGTAGAYANVVVGTDCSPRAAEDQALALLRSLILTENFDQPST